MISSGTIIQITEELAPKSLMMDWDNCGLMIGDYSKKISKVLFTLTITSNSMHYAIANGFDMIISHHPMFFKPLKSLRKDTPLGKIVYDAILNDIVVYSAHTNLDIAHGGVNDVLARSLDLQDIKVLKETPGDDLKNAHPYEGAADDILPLDSPGKVMGIGRVGALKVPIALRDFVCTVKKILKIENVRLVGNMDRHVLKIAVCGGSGGDMVSAAAFAGADVLITGDVKYHDAEDALAAGICVIDAGHFPTENIVMPVFAQYLRDKIGRIGGNIDLTIAVYDGEDPFVTL